MGRVGHGRHEGLKGLAVFGVDVFGVGAGIGGELLLVERLERTVHGVGRHAEPLARELLGPRGVEQRGRTHAAAFALHRVHIARRAGHPLQDLVCGSR